MLIAQGLNIVFVSHQLGHASPSFTLDIYGGLFDPTPSSRLSRPGNTMRWPERPGVRGRSSEAQRLCKERDRIVRVSLERSDRCPDRRMRGRSSDS